MPACIKIEVSFSTIGWYCIFLNDLIYLCKNKVVCQLLSLFSSKRQSFSHKAYNTSLLSSLLDNYASYCSRTPDIAKWSNGTLSLKVPPIRQIQDIPPHFISWRNRKRAEI
jgi:hypothetical protein